MKLVGFEPTNNRWYMMTTVNGVRKRAYLNVAFDDSQEEAHQNALEIMDVLTNYTDPESPEEVPAGLLYEHSEDFRSLLPDCP